MIENDENEFCAFQEENSESENDKISIFEDHDEESISTTVNQNHNESEETNKKDNYYEDKMLDEIEHKPNLCDIILDNLNKKRKSNSPIKITFNSSNKLHSYMNSDGLFQNESSEKSLTNYALFSSNTCEKRLNRFKTNFKDKNKENQINSDEENFESRENVIDISNKSSNEDNNENIIADKKKIDSNDNSYIENINYSENIIVPALLNTLETIYDINSDRNKKRADQMKNRKRRHGSENNDTPQLSQNEIRAKIKVLSTKRFLDDEHNINDNNEHIEVTFPLCDKDTKELEGIGKEENVEVVVSDLEGEIEDKLLEIKTNTSKSFIPITNHLKSKSSSTLDKATPSYLMALGISEDDNNNEESLEGENNFNNANNKNSNNNLLNKQNNYFVADVIEEETSENNTDSEILSSRKKASYLKQEKGSSRVSLNGSKSESPMLLTGRSLKIHNINIQDNNEIINTFPNRDTSQYNEVKQIRYSNSDIPYGPYHREDNQECVNSINAYDNSLTDNGCKIINKFMHKNSKSEYFNFKLDMQKIIENIQKKRVEQGNKRKELMKLRKNILLNKFLKSNSHHNFNGTYYISAPSLSIFKHDNLNNHDEIKRSVFVPKSNFNDNIFKQLSHTEIGVSVNYKNETFLNKMKKIENVSELKIQDDHKINYEEEEKQNVSSHSQILEKNDNEENENDNMELNVEDLDGNRSIIVEKGDEDINFESELNLQLEKNDIKNDFHENNYDAIEIDQDNEHEFLSYESNPVEQNLYNFFERYKHPSFDKHETKLIQLPSKNNFNPLQILPSLNQNNFNKFNKEKEAVTGKYNNKFLNSFLTKDKFSGRSNSLTFLSPIRCMDNKYAAFKRNKSNGNSKLEIAKAAILQITPNNHLTKSIFSNNYIHYNINNISINFLNNDVKTRKPSLNTKNNFTSNTITKEIKNKFAMHVKSSSAFLLKPKITNDLRAQEASSCNKFIKTGQGFLESSSKFKKGVKYSELIASKKAKLLMHKKDLRQYLTFSDTTPNLSESSKFKFYMNYLAHSNPSYSSSNFNRKSQKFNSDHGAQSLIKSSNRLIIIEAMKSLRFQFSSLDHQKFSLDRLNRSKAKSLCLLISKEFRFQNYEFKGLYEMNEDKNSLTKIYSVNAYPSNIEFDDIKKFYHFNSEFNSFEILANQKNLSCDIHAVSIEFSFKNLLKQYLSGK